MTFPTVISVSHHTSTDQTVTHSVALPSNTIEGRLLLMVGVFSGTVMSVNVPSGWIEKVTQDTNGGYEVLFIFAKKTTGSEGSTQTITTGGAGILAASTYLIDNWRGASAADDVKAVLGIPTAGIIAPWPTPNLDPVWGIEDTLWFAVSADLAASTWTLAAPTDYSGLERALAGSHRSVYTARRELRAATHNPADWTVATGSYHNTRWYNQVATIVVRSSEWGVNDVLTGIDVGSVGVAGNTSDAAGVWTLEGSGADIWNTADAFHFAYQRLTGDGTFIARVTGVEGTSSWAKGGLMIRESLNANSKHAFITCHSDQRHQFQWRTSTGGSSQEGYTGLTGFPYWVRLVRSGNNFTGYLSSNGSSWIQQGSTQTISMTEPVYVGLVCCAANNSTLCTATFDNLSGFVAAIPVFHHYYAKMRT